MSQIAGPADMRQLNLQASKLSTARCSLRASKLGASEQSQATKLKGLQVPQLSPRVREPAGEQAQHCKIQPEGEQARRL